MDAAVDGIITIDEDAVIASMNPSAAAMFGYNAMELVGQNVRVMMPDPYSGEHDDYISNYLVTGDAKIIGVGREVEGLRKDGTTFPLYLSIGEVDLHDQRLFTGVVRDITEQNALRDALASLNADLESRNESRTAELAQETAKHRATTARVEEQANELTQTVRGARCILWTADVVDDDGSYEWSSFRFDEARYPGSIEIEPAPGEGYHQAWRRSMPWDARALADAESHRALREGRSGYAVEYPCVDATGGTHWFRDEVSIIPTGTANWRVVGVLTDITERRRSEQLRTVMHGVLEAAHAADTLAEMYRRVHGAVAEMIGSAGFAVAIMDPTDADRFSFAYWTDEVSTVEDGPVLTAPKSRVAIVARTGQLLHMTAEECRAGTDAGEMDLYGAAPNAWLGVPLIVDDLVIGVVRIVKREEADPNTSHLVDVMTYVADQIALGIDRRRTQEALRHEQRLFQGLMDNVPDTIYLKDLQSRFLRINQVGAEALGLDTPADVVGLKDSDIFPDEEESLRYDIEEARLMRTGEPVLGRIGGSADTVWLSITKAPIRDERGDVIGLVGVNRDVSDLMRVQEALRESETHRTQLLEQMLAVAEEERARISRELHDQVGQELTSLLLGLRIIEAAETLDDVRAQTSDLRGVVSETLEDVRQIAFNMRPSSLDDLGLAPALNRDLVTLGRSAGFDVSFRSHNPDDISLPTEIEVGLYRIVHAALMNTVRHAGASSVAVVLSALPVGEGHRVSVLIEDDGVGFDVDAVLSGPVEGRFGLLAMQERARLMGGETTFSSVLGQGTVVLIESMVARRRAPE